MVNRNTWFLSVNNVGRKTRSTADPLNLPCPASQTGEVGRQIFSNRVVEGWNKTPSSLKSEKTMKNFKNGYAHLRANIVENTLTRSR